MVRFWTKVYKSNHCWFWTAATTMGYGVITLRSVRHYAHRLSWTYHKGEIPDGMFVLHKCDTRNCVNPEHLFLGFAQDNSTDMVEKGSACGGGKPKLTLADARYIKKEMRKKYVRGRSLEKRYGVSKSVIYNCANGKTYKYAR